MLIIVDDSNDVQFQGLVEIMQRLHVPMPPNLLNVANVKNLKIYLKSNSIQSLKGIFDNDLYLIYRRLQ